MRSLYNNIRIREFIIEREERLTNDINSLGLIDDKSISEIAEQLANKYTIKSIAFKEPEFDDPKEEEREEWDGFGNRITRKIFKIKVKFPYVGDGDLLFCKPSIPKEVSFREDIIVNENNVKVEITLVELNEVFFNKRVNKLLEKIKTNLPKIHEEIESWNKGLESLIMEKCKSRKEQKQQVLNFMEKIRGK